MNINFEFDDNKDQMLRAVRGISFEEIIACILEDSIIDIQPHHNIEKYPDQFIYHIDIDGYIWLVAAEKRGDRIRLITAYPSRKATKKGKGEHHVE